MDCGIRSASVKNFKLLTFLMALLALGTLAFAEIQMKDIGNGKVEITFLFNHPASEMNVIGSFDNWTEPGEPMTKNANGVWEYVLQASTTDEILYKFYSKGTWTFDPDSPDKKDDGFGGNNGLIVVADILSGETPIKPGAVPVVMLSPASDGAEQKVRQKVQFGTETYIDNTTVFDTKKNEFVENSINAKSIWKLEGDLIPNLPGHIEIIAFDGQTKVTQEFDSDPTLDGLELMTAGFLVNPFYYLGGNKRPVLDTFQVGIDGAWLQWQTGYMNASLPKRDSILWNVISSDIKAGQGYSMFRLGEDLQTLGIVNLDLGLMPNKSLTDYYGLVTWARAQVYGLTLDFQYNMRSNSKDDSNLYFDPIVRQNYIFGLEGLEDALVLRGQYLLARFTPGGAIDSSPVLKRSAYEIEAGYVDSDIGLKALANYAYRGQYAQLFYGENDDLGTEQTQVIGLDVGYSFTPSFSAALDASMLMAADDNKDTNKAIAIKPSVVADLGTLDLYPVRLEAYVNVFYNTEPATDVDAFGLAAFGLKTTLESINVYYKLDNSNKDLMLNSLLADTSLVEGVTIQAGLGYRSGPAAKTNFAAVAGVFKELNAPYAKNPTVYAQFLYNMDPYKNVGGFEYELADFGPDAGASAMDGLGNLRFGINWNY